MTVSVNEPPVGMKPSRAKLIVDVPVGSQLAVTAGAVFVHVATGGGPEPLQSHGAKNDPCCTPASNELCAAADPATSIAAATSATASTGSRSRIDVRMPSLPCPMNRKPQPARLHRDS